MLDVSISSYGFNQLANQVNLINEKYSLVREILKEYPKMEITEIGSSPFVVKVVRSHTYKWINIQTDEQYIREQLDDLES